MSLQPVEDGNESKNLVLYKNIRFLSDEIELAGTLCYSIDAKNTPGVLFLHGGGESSKERFAKWQTHLSKLGISSFAFDFRGVGESKGYFADSSLNNRLTDSVNALDYFLSLGLVDRSRLAIVGASMGGHVATRLIEKFPDIKALIVLSGAAYGKDAEDKKMSEEFTFEIRKRNNWDNSPVFSALKNYAGFALVIYGENDSIIPEDVKKKYRDNIQRGEYLSIQYGQHSLLDPQGIQEEQVMMEIFERTAEFLNKTIK